MRRPVPDTGRTLRHIACDATHEEDVVLNGTKKGRKKGETGNKGRTAWIVDIQTSIDQDIRTHTCKDPATHPEP